MPDQGDDVSDNAMHSLPSVYSVDFTERLLKSKGSNGQAAVQWGLFSGEDVVILQPKSFSSEEEEANGEGAEQEEALRQMTRIRVAQKTGRNDSMLEEDEKEQERSLSR